MEDKSKVGWFSWYLFQHIGSLVADTTCMWSSGDLANRHATSLAAGWKKVLSVWRVLLQWVWISPFCEDGSFFPYALPQFLSEASGSFCILLNLFIILFILFPPTDATHCLFFFSRALLVLNSEFSFSYISCLTKVKEFSLPYYLPIVEVRWDKFMPFLKEWKWNRNKNTGHSVQI